MIRVLVVDDHAIVRHGLERLLNNVEGIEVVGTAADGAEAIAAAASAQPHVVLMDLSMPGMDGGEVAVKMRESKPDVPILLLSAYLDLPPEVTSLVALYMTKGEGAPALLTNLNNLLQPVSASQ